MEDNFEEMTETYDGKTKGRILFTGGMEHIADNLMEHVPAQYEKLKCQPNETDVNKALESFKPHVVVICLLDGLSEKVAPYNALAKNTDYAFIPVISIGYEEDCDRFRRKLIVKKLYPFFRPLDTEKFFETLDVCVEESEKLLTQQQKTPQPKMAEKVEVHEDESFWEDKLKELETDQKPSKKVRHMSLIRDRKSILVVDDDVQMLNVIKLYLQDLYDITVVPSGKLALKFLEKKHADLVLLDYMMPEMDGAEVLTKIRKMDELDELPVVFLTGVADKDQVFHVLGLHPRGYLLKPVTREVLLERVTEILLEL